MGLSTPEDFFVEADRMRQVAADLDREGARRLQERRLLAGLSQRELASVMGTTQAQVSHIENGRTTNKHTIAAYMSAVEGGSSDGKDSKQSRGAEADLAKARRRRH